MQTTILAAEADVEAERHRLTLEALADVDAGRVVDDAVVQTWIASLGTDHELPVPQA